MAAFAGVTVLAFQLYGKFDLAAERVEVQGKKGEMLRARPPHSEGNDRIIDVTAITMNAATVCCQG